MEKFKGYNVEDNCPEDAWLKGYFLRKPYHCALQTNNTVIFSLIQRIQCAEYVEL